jgi:hypothetical protein
MIEPMDIYENKYNTKYNENVKFFGSIEVFKIDEFSKYIIMIKLTVIKNKKNVYSSNKEFFITDPKDYTNKTLEMDNYEFIDILNELNNLL